MNRRKPSDIDKIIDEKVEELIIRYNKLECIRIAISQAARVFVQTAADGGSIFICGNGGSAADADHIVGELMKSFRKRRPIQKGLRELLEHVDLDAGSYIADFLQDGLPALALTQHTALQSAFSNDVKPDLVFAQQLSVLGKKNDLLWALTTSGNSRNVYYAAVTAQALGMNVVGMTGDSGGKLGRIADLCLEVPEQETYKIQELHLPIYHTLCIILEDAFW